MAYNLNFEWSEILGNLHIYPKFVNNLLINLWHM